MLSLPLDVIHGVLLQLSDFESLYAILSSSKTTRSVYEKSPASIMRTVAENIVHRSCLIPPALRLARWTVFAEENEDKLIPWQESVKSEDLPGEIYPPPDDVLTWKEAKHLQRFAKYTRLYEDQFSRRFKNRHQLSSALTESESIRFRIAFYRLWLFWCLPPHIGVDGTEDEIHSEGFLTDDELLDEDEDDNDDGEIGGIVEEDETQVGGAMGGEVDGNIDHALNAQTDHTAPKRLSCVQVFEDLVQSDLLDIAFVQSFLEIFESDVRKNGERTHWMGLYMTDHALPDWTFDRYVRINGYVPPRLSSNHATLEQLLKPFVPGVSESDLTRPFLVDVKGKDDTCCQCHQITGLQLRCLNNLNDISCKIGLLELFDMMPGLIRLNRTEKNEFIKYLDANPNINMEMVLNEIYSLNLQQAPSNWGKDDEFCLSCWKVICSSCCRDWWFHTKSSMPNYVAKEDCWYGQDCRTQSHKTAHAEKLNHLCDFTGPKQDE